MIEARTREAELVEKSRQKEAAFKKSVDDRLADLAGRESEFQEAWVKREAELQKALSEREAGWLQAQRDALAAERREWEESRGKEIDQRRREMELSVQQREKLLEETMRARQKEVEGLLMRKEKDLILAYDDQIFKARTELDAAYRAREEALELKYLEIERKLTSEGVAKENAFALQKRDLVEREIAALRKEFAEKAAEFERRIQDGERQFAERQAALETDCDRRKGQLEAAAAAERDELRAAFDKRSQDLETAYREKFQQVEADKNRAGDVLLRKEEELAKHFQKLERELRNELNLTRIEHAAQYDERLRKLGEERAALQKDYESKLRELEARNRKPGPGA